MSVCVCGGRRREREMHEDRAADQTYWYEKA